MANFAIHGFTEFMTQLNKLADSEAIALDMVKGGQQTLYNKMYSVAQAQPYPESVTGALKKSLKKMRVKNKSGTVLGYVKYYGYDKGRKTKDGKGVPNTVKAIALEYGASGRPAHPFVKDSVDTAEPEVLETMQNEFNKHIQ